MKHIIQFIGYLAAGFILMFAFSLLLGKWGVVKAATGDIVCETAYKEKTLLISHGAVAFSKGEYSAQARSISSVDNVRTEKKHKGFIKILQLDGQKHRIRINNVEAFSEVEDSLKITSPKGHEITYPLTCRTI
jgi:hypothetical protein